MSNAATPDTGGCFAAATRIPDGCFASEEMVFPDDLAAQPLWQMFCATVDALSAQEDTAQTQGPRAVRRLRRRRRRFVKAYARR